MSLLEIRELTKNFGGLRAVHEVTFQVERGEILGLIGPNGSGKSTTLNLMSGVYPCNGGQIYFKGEEITNLPPHVVTRKGIGRTFQGSRVFANLSVLENVMRGRHCRTQSHLLGAILRNASAVRELEETQRKAMQFLERIGLVDKKDMPVGSLPFAHRSLVGMGMALATEPELILLDEPIAGMNPHETLEVMAFIQRVRDGGITILLVEHNMKVIMEICERIVVLNYGAKIAEGTPAEISRNPEVIKAYLGREYGAKPEKS
jgi:branched-chain amino acid transport system ATP-binding protein